VIDGEDDAAADEESGDDGRGDLRRAADAARLLGRGCVLRTRIVGRCSRVLLVLPSHRLAGPTREDFGSWLWVDCETRVTLR
jgi:hypothetical protein